MFSIGCKIIQSVPATSKQRVWNLFPTNIDPSDCTHTQSVFIYYTKNKTKMSIRLEQASLSRVQAMYVLPYKRSKLRTTEPIPLPHFRGQRHSTDSIPLRHLGPFLVDTQAFGWCRPLDTLNPKKVGRLDQSEVQVLGLPGLAWPKTEQENRNWSARTA